MQFSNTSEYNGIIQNCETLSKLGNGGITGNTILFGKFTGWINDAYAEVAMAAMTADKNWRWDDNNYTTPNSVPVATNTLTDGVRDIILPRATNAADQSTLWRVYKVRLKDLNGEWYTLEPLASDEDEIDDSGRPTKYRLLGNSVRLSGPPSSTAITLSAGIQVWFQREFIKFTTASTTQMPGFMSSFHHLLELKASSKYLLPTDAKLAMVYLAMFDKGILEVQKAYAQRQDDPKTTKRMVPNVEDNR